MEEQLYLQITLLTNGYSRDYVETQLKHFYHFFNTARIRYCCDPSIYAQLRRQIFDFINKQKREEHNQLIHFYYPYDYGPYRQFNRKFDEHWSRYIKPDPQLPSKEMKLVLNTKPIYSLNALLTQQKPSDELLKT